ncbi:glycine betaine ABC transporter substrate-binding protein [Rhodococcus sp. UNC363MFTsu5.1]|uniref:glycine betaine ABC transporter substrate-binding protein n=1 Tax=Rhodococcus sp. UNC363MFTsu5.1 TaxID=1449069 RepID=UPI0009DD9C8B|nr:glycine betaine ABC transporter substrate-binding protein [Rhodococcus sp. UNC363MFTsu5.1]
MTARWRKAAGTVMSTAVVFALTGCTVDNSRLDEAQAPAAITVGSGESAESQVVAGIYAEILRGTGSPVEEGAAETRAQYVEDLGTADITVVPDFTGQLLHFFQPDSTLTDPDEVFEELNRSLPEGLSVSDYSDAEVKTEGDATAENVVPLMRSGVLTEDQVKALNVVAGELTSADLAAMVERVRVGELTPAQAADEWLAAR